MAVPVTLSQVDHAQQHAKTRLLELQIQPDIMHLGLVECRFCQSMLCHLQRGSY